MTLHANYDDGKGNPVFAGDLATRSGWGNFCRFVDTLPVEGYEALIHLTEHGCTPDLATLEKQLAAALKKAKDPNVKATAENLLGIVKRRPKRSEGIYVAGDD